MVNKAILIGRLGRDAEVRYTQTKTPVATLSVATSRKWKSQTGAPQEKTEWHKVIIWGPAGEYAGTNYKKGALVYVEGEITYREYEGKDGVKKYSTEIVAAHTRLVGSHTTEAEHAGEGDNGELTL